MRFSGESSELLLHAFGRKQSRVDIDGNDADVLAVEDLRRSF